MPLIKRLSKSVLSVVFSFLCLLILPPSSGALERVNSEVLADAIQTVEEIDRMRSVLASSIDPNEMGVDQETFSLVCKPVGKRIRQVAKAKGWEFRQFAIKHRNPKNKPDPESLKAMKQFEKDPNLRGLWKVDARQGKQGLRYYQRITVEPACLVCHGKKEEQPDFVKNKYPNDRAFGFTPGDLRGIYSIHVRNSQ
jgi:hypothetical protein